MSRGSAAPQAAARDAALIRAMGVWGLAAAIANVTVGGGIFRLPSSAAAALGPAAPVAYVICALVMGLIVLCIAEAGSRVALTGGPYAYVEVAFGPFAGYLTGVMVWLTGAAAFGAIGTVFLDNLGALVPVFARRGARTAALLIVFGGLAAVNVVGVKHGARLVVVTIIAKLLPLLLLLVVGLFAIDPANLAVAEMPAVQTISRASIVLLFAFTGIESALVPSGEVRDPARTVPRAVFLAMGGVTVLYLGLQYVAQGVLGPALASSATPLADAAGVVFGPWGRTMLLVGVLISTFGYLSGMMLALPRSLYAFARDGMLPGVLAKVHPAWRTPWIAILVQAALAVLLTVATGFERLAVISNVGALLAYLGCAAAAIELRRRGIREPDATPFRIPGAAVVPVLAMLAIAWLLTSITADEWLVLLQVTGVATALFVAMRTRRAQKSKLTE
jgi:APA family basic amino acid/polyamine antiporter